MLELHACSIAAKPCEPRLHERLLFSADISLKRVDGLFEPLDNNDVSTVKDLARLRAQYLAAVTIQRAALPFITRRLSAAIAQLRVRYAAASPLGQTDILFQLAQRASGPTRVTEHTGKAAAGQMRGGEAASRASAKRRRACDSWSETDSGDVDECGADDDY